MYKVIIPVLVTLFILTAWAVEMYRFYKSKLEDKKDESN